MEYLCNTSTKNGAMKLNMKLSYKLILSILVGMTSYAQSIQNNKFAKSLQHLKNAVRNEVDFFCADKHQSSLQIDTFTFDGCGQACLKYSK